MTINLKVIEEMLCEAKSEFLNNENLHCRLYVDENTYYELLKTANFKINYDSDDYKTLFGFEVYKVITNSDFYMDIVVTEQ